MPSYRGVPLSDDEYGERCREANEAVGAHLCAVFAEVVKVCRTCEEMHLSLASFDTVMEQARRDFEATLSPDEFLRYETILQDDPECGWLDAAVLVRP